MVPLMPTPVLYTELNTSPLEHIPEEEQWNPRKVYYATIRERESDLQTIHYSNQPSERVSVGLALIGFGGDHMTWSDLQEASRQEEREESVDLSIAGILEAGSFHPADPAGTQSGPLYWLTNDLNLSISGSRDPDLLIYVHGAKVNFYNACAFAAQLDHFLGRDMTSMAFSWPTRQNIIAYASGSDVKRAYNAAESFATILELLAEQTEARRIHIVAWSAGSRVVTSAVSLLRNRHPDLSARELEQTFRIGTLYFAASEIPRDEFIRSLPDLDDLARRIVVTVSSHDSALKQAKRFMGGDIRLGQLGGPLSKEEQHRILNTESLEIIDLSLAGEDRGFDITGHRYWFDHSWASTDLILSLRTDLNPLERGLLETEYPVLWGIPSDYPERLNRIPREMLQYRDQDGPP